MNSIDNDESQCTVDTAQVDKNRLMKGNTIVDKGGIAPNKRDKRPAKEDLLETKGAEP